MILKDNNNPFITEHKKEFLEVRFNNIITIGKAFEDIQKDSLNRELNLFEIEYIKQSMIILENDVKEIRKLI